MIVRAADSADLDAVAALEQANLGADAWSHGLIAEGIAGTLPTVRYLVAADDDGTVVGHAVASIVADIAELQRISVAPEHRRGGVASALLAAVVEAGRTERADRLLLEVREDNHGALAFYAARGLVEVDRRPRYYSDGSTAVVMRLGLGPTCGWS